MCLIKKRSYSTLKAKSLDPYIVNYDTISQFTQVSSFLKKQDYAATKDTQRMIEEYLNESSLNIDHSSIVNYINRNILMKEKKMLRSI